MNRFDNNIITVCPLSMASDAMKQCTSSCAFYYNGKCSLAEAAKVIVNSNTKDLK